MDTLKQMKSGSYSALVRSTSLSQKTKIATPRGNYTCLLDRGGVQYEPTGTAHSIVQQEAHEQVRQKKEK